MIKLNEEIHKMDIGINKSNWNYSKKNEHQNNKKHADKPKAVSKINGKADETNNNKTKSQ